jgi:CPA1 family monovalent cation:H+ antiporter
VYVVEEPGMPLILRLWARSGERRQPLGSILVRCGVELDGDEATLARAAAYRAGLAEIARARVEWPGHSPLLDRLESGLLDRTQHLATDDPVETADRHQERVEHEQIQRGVIGAQRTAVIELRDRREINDRTLRAIERDLDLEELRMEG